jgi:betaine-aldehyde dehydrogenase
MEETSVTSIHERYLPQRRDLYYGGAWQVPSGGYAVTVSPATGEDLGACAEADAHDVDRAVAAAKEAFATWRYSLPQERATLLRRIARVVRDNAHDLAMVDAVNCGSPLAELLRDAEHAATYLDFFAGLAPEIKGSTMQSGAGAVNYTLREPVGVCARILAYNHPLMFLCTKLAPAVAAGNTVVMKPPAQAPLSAYRLLELIDGILPPGVLNVVTGGTACGEALVAHPDVPVVTLIGGAATGRAIMRGAADRLKRVLFELGGKNAMIVYPDADLDRAVAGAAKGMNFGWAGQSCGSTSRLFVHDSVYDTFLARLVPAVDAYRPGLPTDPATNMGALISRAQLDKVERYVARGVEEGARLVLGGARPEDGALADGFFHQPTIFADVTPTMAIACEEIFGPVLSVLRWHDEDELYRAVNDVEYGLTAAVFTRDLASAHRASARIEAGYVWINNTGIHVLGAPYGGVKQSGIGREESIDELMEFTQLKSVNITL